jgi:hypothetical protein
MMDIISITDDIRFLDTQAVKARNVLVTQLDSLEYAPTFGVDIAYFLDENFVFQDESFKAYLINRLTASGINVNEVVDVVSDLYRSYTFKVGNEKNEGLIK